jgi:hypothetical protein
MECNNPVDSNLDNKRNTWYLGHVAASYVAHSKKPKLLILDSLRTIHNAWIYSHSNAGYTVIARYYNDSEALPGVLFNGNDSISLHMYRMVLDDEVFYSSLIFGPTTYYSIDSSVTEIKGKPIILLDKNIGYSAVGADSVAYILKVGSNNFSFKINGVNLRWAQFEIYY